MIFELPDGKRFPSEIRPDRVHYHGKVVEVIAVRIKPEERGVYHLDLETGSETAPKLETKANRKRGRR